MTDINHSDEGLVARAHKRVLGATTISATIDGEVIERLDARVAALAAEHGHCTRADVVRSALGRYLDAVDALDRPNWNNWSEDDPEVIRAATALSQYLDGDTEETESWMGAAAVAVNAAFPKATP